MTEYSTIRTIELLLVFSMIGALITLLLIHTIIFSVIRRIEDYVATPGKELDSVRRVWGNGPIGRWMRAVHLHMFFIFRRLPLYGKSIEARFGDETTTVPTRLKMAFMVPMSLFYLFTLILIGCGVYLDKIP